MRKIKYRPKIVPTYSPSRWWGGGQWETGKDHKDKIGGAHYTGREERNLIGYRLFMMCILPNGVELLTEPLPKNNTKIFKTRETAKEYFDKTVHLVPGNTFSTFMYSEGVIDEYSL